MNQQEDQLLETQSYSSLINSNDTSTTALTEKLLNIPRLTNSVYIHKIQENPTLAALFILLSAGLSGGGNAGFHPG